MTRPLPAGAQGPGTWALHWAAPGRLQPSLVVYKRLHLVDQVPGNPQDLLGIMAFSPLWGNMHDYGEAEGSPVAETLT